jgi:hypothetical protein
MSERTGRDRRGIELFRPVGQAELDLIREAGFKAFPPRLPHQPVFYPVLVEAYAMQIARDWNARDAASGYVGYVTRFEADRQYASQFPVQKVGNADALELWVPAEPLDDFNRHLIGLIEVVQEFRPAKLR